jgi:RND family efflux transporter MFP subunit
VAPGQPAFEVAAVESLEIQVGLPENLVNAVRVGQKAQVAVPAVPGAAREGTLRLVNAAADPASRTYMARVAVPNPQGLLRLGMVAEVRVQGDAEEDQLVVPCDAVVQDAQGATQVFEYRPAEGRVVARRVVVGRLDGQGIQIRSGVDASSWIVVAGQHGLRDGNPVRVEPGTPLASARKD